MALSPADRVVLAALGYTVSWIAAHPIESFFIAVNFRNNPVATFRLLRLYGVGTLRFSGQMLLGTARILAPSFTASVEATASSVATVARTPGLFSTGGLVSKVAFPAAIFATGIAMIREARAKASRGDIGGETTLGQFVTEAEFDEGGRLRVHQLGGPGGLIV